MHSLLGSKVGVRIGVGDDAGVSVGVKIGVGDDAGVSVGVRIGVGDDAGVGVVVPYKFRPLTCTGVLLSS